MQSTTDIAINESSPLVGSSQNNKLGFVINYIKLMLSTPSMFQVIYSIFVYTSQANANLLFSPPDIPFIFFETDPIKVFSHFFKLSFINIQL